MLLLQRSRGAVLRVGGVFTGWSVTAPLATSRPLPGLLLSLSCYTSFLQLLEPRPRAAEFTLTGLLFSWAVENGSASEPDGWRHEKEAAGTLNT